LIHLRMFDYTGEGRGDGGRLSCVVIGLNCARTIVPCLESIKGSDYDGPIEVIYVDGGSADGSPDLAKAVGGVDVIELRHVNPTPGRGRNAGWKASKGEVVHFFDADVKADRLWLRNALGAFGGKTAAVCGNSMESHPDRNWYHMVADIEWKTAGGDARYFGGVVAIKRKVLEETGGYDEGLIAGEDPELSSRITMLGYGIRRLDETMCYHDIDMTGLMQYFRRCFRTGYGYAEAGLMLAARGDTEWSVRTAKVVAKTAATATLLAAGYMLESPALLFLALLCNAAPIAKIPYFRRRHSLTWRKSVVYALHLSVCAYPMALGCLRYFGGKLTGRPYTNRGLVFRRNI